MTRLTQDSRHARASTLIQVHYCFPHLRGFFPLKRDACARWSSNSRARFAFISSAAAFAFFLAAYCSPISPCVYRVSWNNIGAHFSAIIAFNATILVQVNPALTFRFLTLQLVGTTTPAHNTIGAQLNIHLHLCTGTVVCRPGTWRLRHCVTSAA